MSAADGDATGASAACDASACAAPSAPAVHAGRLCASDRGIGRSLGGHGTAVPCRRAGAHPAKSRQGTRMTPRASATWSRLRPRDTRPLTGAAHRRGAPSNRSDDLEATCARPGHLADLVTMKRLSERLGPAIRGPTLCGSVFGQSRAVGRVPVVRRPAVRHRVPQDQGEDRNGRWRREWDRALSPLRRRAHRSCADRQFSRGRPDRSGWAPPALGIGTHPGVACRSADVAAPSRWRARGRSPMHPPTGDGPNGSGAGICRGTRGALGVKRRMAGRRCGW
jgi:hypothetical protein